MNDDDDESCHNCKYLWSTEDGTTGTPWRHWCRRYPPKSLTDPEGYVCSMFPEVTLTHWCGEYAPARIT